MEEQLVSLEVAKLLKEKGFNEPCCYLYDKQGRLSIVEVPIQCENPTMIDFFSNYDDEYNIYPTRKEYILCCTQSLAQKWLRETKGVIVIVDYDTPGTTDYYSSRVISKDSNCIVGHYQRTYEEALEEGLKEGLKLI